MGGYHHEDLRSELIEAGIRIISEEGFERLSVRNLSSRCGVSHNAIYRHFESKDAMIAACRDHAAERLTERLEAAASEYKAGDADAVGAVCRAYILFYKENPEYFSFLYRNSGVRIIFTMDESEKNYPPFDVFRRVCGECGKTLGISRKETLDRLIRCWSVMHGAISLIISPNVQADIDIGMLTKNIF